MARCSAVLMCQLKVKGEGIYTVVPHTEGAQAWITQFHRQITPCLPLPRKRSPDGASPD